MRLLLIEDDKKVADAVAKNLRAESFAEAGSAWLS